LLRRDRDPSDVYAVYDECRDIDDMRKEESAQSCKKERPGLSNTKHVAKPGEREAQQN
jgi:hypothetical protein